MIVVLTFKSLVLDHRKGGNYLNNLDHFLS